MNKKAILAILVLAVFLLTVVQEVSASYYYYPQNYNYVNWVQSYPPYAPPKTKYGYPIVPSVNYNYFSYYPKYYNDPYYGATHNRVVVENYYYDRYPNTVYRTPTYYNLPTYSLHEVRVDPPPTVYQPQYTYQQKRTFIIEGREYYFDKTVLRVNHGDNVKIVFLNRGENTHNWGIDEFHVRTRELYPGDYQILDFVADRKGEFYFYCSVPGNRNRGMEGRLIVE